MLPKQDLFHWEQLHVTYAVQIRILLVCVHIRELRHMQDP